MTRLDASRRLVADPASVALLLAGPPAVEAWPRTAGRTVVADPPTRFGAGYGVRVQIHEGDVVVGTARMWVMPAEHVDGHLRCELRMTSHCDDEYAADIAADVDTYLKALGSLAESRATAA